MSGTLRWNKKHRQYQADVRIGGIRKRPLLGTNKEIAEAVLNDLRDQRIRAKHGVPSWVGSESITLDEYAPSYIGALLVESRAPRTIKIREDVLGHHVQPVLGMLPLARITRQQVQAYILTRLKAGAAPGTVRVEVDGLRHLLRMAFRDGLIPAVPELPRPKASQGRGRFLSVEEVDLLLVAIRPAPVVERFVKVALATGLRSEEIIRLYWRDVDWRRRSLRVAWTKTGKALNLPLVPALLEELRAAKGRPADYLIRLDDRPRHATKQAIASRLGRLAEKAGLGIVSPHVLRRTFASHLLLTGADPGTARDALGHSNIRMTDRYTLSPPTALRAAVEALPWAKGATGGQHLRPVDQED